MNQFPKVIWQYEDHRSGLSEMMDELTVDDHVLSRTLRELDTINDWLGGIRPTLQQVGQIINQQPHKPLWHILDIGCGSGHVLRKIAAWARGQNVSVLLTGMDLSEATVRHAELTTKDETIQYLQGNVLESKELLESADILLFTLTMHHLQDSLIIELLQYIQRHGGCHVVINDLERNVWAFRLFKMLGAVTPMSSMARYDGEVSITRSFKRRDWENYFRQADIHTFSIKRKWAFRWLVTIYPNDHKNHRSR